MASFNTLYNDIEYKVKQAQQRLKDTKLENKKLQEENEELKQLNQQLQNQVQALDEKIKLMTITQTIIKKEDKTETKRKITELVREIDNCIGLLNS